METDSLADLAAAQNDIMTLITTSPDAALDWKPDETSWSLKQTLAHVAHAYDFYLMIVEEARKSAFGVVKLHPDLPGWRRLQDTDAAVLACATTAEVCGQLNVVYQRAVAILSAISPEELDRSFTLESWRPDVAPETTTLRKRVLEMVADHLREHYGQLAETLAQWRDEQH